MIVENKLPPMWDAVIDEFGDIANQAVFTFGPKCYNPTGRTMSPDLIKHEEVHVEQQEASEDVAVLWWKRYLQDPEFRLDQEAEAYAAQYKFLCQSIKDKNQRFRLLMDISNILSGPLYGNIISSGDAMRKVKEYL